MRQAEHKRATTQGRPYGTIQRAEKEETDMQGFDTRELGKLIERIDKVIEEAPEKRKELHEALADEMKKKLDGKIASSLNDSHGTIRSWQVKSVGSKGGYAAVRAKRGETGANSPGAITNYLESGHKIRTPKGGKNYTPRIHVQYVLGKHFYAAVRGKLTAVVMKAGEDYIKERLGEIEK